MFHQNDDLYSGYDDYAPGEKESQYQSMAAIGTTTGPGMSRGIGSSMGRPPMTGAAGARNPGISRAGANVSRAGPGPSRMANRAGTNEETSRPMTSVRGAGYSSAAPPGTAAGANPLAGFDPFNQGARGPAAPLQKKSESSKEEQMLEQERKITEIMEAGTKMLVENDAVGALEKAKDAGKKERILCRNREQLSLGDQINIDLTYLVCFNLAVTYQHAEMHTESLNAYSAIVKNRAYTQAGRLRVNMGNVYYSQQKYPHAIKMYRMALDQVPSSSNAIRHRIMRNIGNCFVKTGQYDSAIQAYENIMESGPELKTAYNLSLCYYAIGDGDRMKRTFSRMLSLRPLGVDPDAEEDEEDENTVLTEDKLKSFLRVRYQTALKMVSHAAKLLAPIIDRDMGAGYDFVIESLRASIYSELASDMENSKAMAFLRRKEFSSAVETLKSFARKDESLVSRAATNLSFLYFLEGDLKRAEKYAATAVKVSRYNAQALVNMGNCHYARKKYNDARDLYLEAIGVEADCVEAIYNLGLCYRKSGKSQEALECFLKLQPIIPSSVEVMYSLASIYEDLNRFDEAVKWYNILVTRVPTDASALHALGNLYARIDDLTQAYTYMVESYRFYPVNLDVIAWLGAYYVKTELYEKAMVYFQRASSIQPQEVKWQLMIASCHRRVGAYQQALEIYEAIHQKFPENVECLKYLVHLCDDLKMTDKFREYTKALRAAERNAPPPAPVEAAPASTEEAPSTHTSKKSSSVAVAEENEKKSSIHGGVEASSSGPRAATTVVAANEHLDGHKVVKASKKVQEEEEWGEGELGDDLLPM